MIIHIFTANRYHLVPNISKGYINNYAEFEHKFILYGNKKLNKQLYIDLYKEYGFSDYHFCTSYYQYIKLLCKYRKQPILFHAGNYSWFLIANLIRAKNINWVCWGAGASIGKSFISRMITPLKIYLYNSFSRIITLMDQDGTSIIRDFKVKENKIETIPYASGKIGKYDKLYEELSKEKIINNSKIKVLLGNNPGNISEYIFILDYLEKYKGKITVNCMLNYSLKKNNLYYDLISKGKQIFADDFHTDEDFLPDFADYIRYMSEYDIYICSTMQQTGLGAINTMINLGKKIYITGKNYEWITSKDLKIFDMNDILSNLSFEEFSASLTTEQRKYNFDKHREISAINPKKWINFFKRIENESS